MYTSFLLCYTEEEVPVEGRRGRDHMVVGLTTIYASFNVLF
jgi:hypothetical protein